MNELNNVLNFFKEIHIPNYSELIIIIKYYIINSYNFVYPFIIKYIIIINEYKIIAWITIFLLFHLLFFMRLKLTNKDFNLLLYLICFTIMPFSILLLLLLLTDILFKKYILYKLFNVEYPYIKYDIRRRIIEVDKIMNIRETYNNRFKK